MLGPGWSLIDTAKKVSADRFAWGRPTTLLPPPLLSTLEYRQDGEKKAWGLGKGRS
jgi:hypothetical protein